MERMFSKITSRSRPKPFSRGFGKYVRKYASTMLKYGWKGRENIMSARPRISLKSIDDSTAMALKIAVERNSCLRQFWQFPRHFSNYCNKTLILLFLCIFDKLETCLRISLLVIYEWFDQHLNSSNKVVMHSE
jgi:hypothetical protein